MDATKRILRPRRREESGQVLVLFILIMVTCFLLACVAVIVGQVMVRRHQAQVVVDAAAFAGASAQAEGLNTIARLNEKSLWFLQAIEVSILIPYVDDDNSTYGRLTIGAATLFYDDWAGDLLSEYQEVFDFYNDLIDIANCAYAPRVVPQIAARDVVDENFDGADRLFFPEDLAGQGLADPLVWAQSDLVELTERETYDIGAYWYLPWPSNAIVTAFPPWTVAYAYGRYLAEILPAVWFWRWAEPIEYEIGRFYDNEEGDDVRFAYYLEVDQAPVLFGKNFFDEIPPIVVAAAAKPYGGYLGDEWEKGSMLNGRWNKNFPWPLDDLSFLPWGIRHENQDGKEISATYKAKLVPLTTGERAGIAAQNDVWEDAGRWLTVLH